MPVKLHIFRQCFKIRHHKKPYNTHRYECWRFKFRFTMVMSSLKVDTTDLGWLQTAGACPLCLLLSQSSAERLRNSYTLLIDSYWHWAGCLFSALSQSWFPASVVSGLVSFMGFMTEPWHFRHVLFLCECTSSSVLEPCALSSPCLVLCWSMVSDPGTHVLSFSSCRGLDTRAPCSVLLCERTVSSPLDRALSCPRVLCCVARRLCISLAACFHVVMSCVNMRLMSILISCVFVCCFAHAWWFDLLATCLCFCFMWAHGFVLVFCVPCIMTYSKGNSKALNWSIPGPWMFTVN